MPPLLQSSSSDWNAHEHESCQNECHAPCRANGAERTRPLPAPQRHPELAQHQIPKAFTLFLKQGTPVPTPAPVCL